MCETVRSAVFPLVDFFSLMAQVFSKTQCQDSVGSNCERVVQGA